MVRIKGVPKPIALTTVPKRVSKRKAHKIANMVDIVTFDLYPLEIANLFVPEPARATMATVVIDSIRGVCIRRVS